MFKWSARVFTAVFFVTIGVMVARELLPVRREFPIVVRQGDTVPPQIMTWVLTDTIRVPKWRDRVVEKIKYRDVPPETVEVYKERVSPIRFKALFTNGEIQLGDRFTYNTYSFTDSTISHFSHRIRSDHVRFWIDQRYGIPRVEEGRNWFDAPDLELGWMSGEGLYAESELRVWRLYPKVRGNQEGISYGGAVKYEF